MTNQIDNGKPLMNEGRGLFHPQRGSYANRRRVDIQAMFQVHPSDYEMRSSTQAPTSAAFRRIWQLRTGCTNQGTRNVPSAS